MNKEKVKRIARDLSTMTMSEALAVIGTLNRDHGNTVIAGIIQMLEVATHDMEEANNAITGRLQLISITGMQVPVIKVLREHYRLGLKEAKTIVDSTPIVLEGTVEGIYIPELTATQKLKAAEALRNAGAIVVFL